MDQRGLSGRRGRARHAGVIVIAILILALAGAAPAWAVNSYYPNISTDTTNSGSSCASGSPNPCSLRDAVTLAGNAGADSEVVLNGGTYHLTQGGPLLPGGTVVNTPHMVTVLGSGSTIDASGNGLNTAMASGSNSLDFEDLTVTGAQEGALSYDGNGGVTLNQVTFSTNGSTAENASPVLIEQAGALFMTDVTFTGNAGESDGGLEIDGVTGEASLTNLTFTGNQGDALEVGTSGGTFGLLTMDGLVFRNNTARYVGVASINSGSSSASIDHLDLEDNTGGPFVRGTLSLFGKYSKLDDITSAGNTLDSAGAGAIFSPTGTVTARNWTVSGNTSTAGPSSSGPAEAGGIDVVGGTVDLDHATIADNSAGGNADDLHTSGTGTVTISNSIVSGTSASGAVPCAADGGAITSAGHNIDRGSSCGFTAQGDMSNTDPRLAPLAQTVPVSTRALLYASPAVDAASSPCPSSDAIGTKRPVGVACDIGAFESPLTDLAVTGTASPTQTAPGGAVTYTFTVSNSSNTNPQAVQFTDTLPAGAAPVSAAASSGSCTNGAQVVCALPSVHRGGNVMVTVVAKLTHLGSNADTAHVQSELPDSNMGNDTTSVGVTVASSPGGSSHPALSGLHVTPTAFRAGKGKGHGATIAYTDSVGERVTFTVLRRRAGIRVKGRCVAPGHAHGKHAACKRLVKVGSFSVAGRAGSNTVSFSGRLGGHALAPGSYELSSTETGAKAVSATFSIKRPIAPKK